MVMFGLQSQPAATACAFVACEEEEAAVPLVARPASGEKSDESKTIEHGSSLLVEVRVEYADLRDLIDREVVPRGRFPDRLRSRSVVDAERPFLVLAHVR